MSENNDSTLSQAGRGSVANTYGDIPLVFLQEKILFGDRNTTPAEWIKHKELYKTIGEVIDSSHITGLQRFNSMWRIYPDNINDKVTLLAEVVPFREKRLKLLGTNPGRPDGEQTVRIRVKNIPLSVDDGPGPLFSKNLM